MPDTSPALTSDAIRRQVLLEGVKEGEHKKFAKFLRDLDKSIRMRLAAEGETIASQRRLNILLADINNIQKGIYSEYTAQFELDLDDIAIAQAELEVSALNKTVSDFESVIPAENQLLAAYKGNPLSVVGKSQGLTLKPFLKQYTTDQISFITGAINQGFAEGQTISQITRKIRGTRSGNFNNGQLAVINRNNRIMVRTAVQNAGEQARQKTWDANSDLIKGVKWVSTLDSRTTKQCQSLDGREFPIDKGARPPIHYGCRSTVTPVLSEKFDFLKQGSKRPEKGADGAGQTTANTTYYSWLKTQPASFQDSVIGDARGKLLRNGGLTSDEFAKLQLNKNFKPLTLAEMKEKAPEAFDAANIELSNKGMPITKKANN
jgi:SPP1 gp7 family putative phage head morphogenesis protein